MDDKNTQIALYFLASQIDPTGSLKRQIQLILQGKIPVKDGDDWVFINK